MKESVNYLENLLYRPEGKDGLPHECREAFSHLAAVMEEPDWSDPQSERWQDILLGIILFKGEINFRADDPFLPHSLPPEDMMRSLALQALADWGDANCLPTIRQYLQEIRHPRLVMEAEQAIQQIQARGV